MEKSLKTANAARSSVTRALGGAFLWATAVVVVGCAPAPGGEKGAVVDLSPGQQDITFALRIVEIEAIPDKKLQLLQQLTTVVTVELVDDDRGLADDIAENEDFTAPVDIRIVDPPPLGVRPRFGKTQLLPGETTTLELSVDPDAPQVEQVFLLAGTIHGGETTRYFPQIIATHATCLPGYNRARSIAADGQRSAAALEDGSLVVWGQNDVQIAAPGLAANSAVYSWFATPQVTRWWAPRAVDGISSVARVEDGDPYLAMHLEDGGHRLLGPYYASTVGAPVDRPGWETFSLPTSERLAQLAFARDEFGATIGYALQAADGDVQYWQNASFGRWYESDAGSLGFAVLPSLQFALGGAEFLMVLRDRTVEARALLPVWHVQQPGQACESCVRSLTGVRAVAAGAKHALALMADGTVKAWGDNRSGQSGIGTLGTVDTPEVVQGVSNVIAIAAGNYLSLALRADGTVLAWGTYGEAGGAAGARPTPIEVAGLTEVVAIAAGHAHALALRADGTVWAWGRNDYGQLGDTTDDDVQLSPMRVPGIGFGFGSRVCRNSLPPAARFTQTPLTAVAGEPVLFDGSSSSGDTDAGRLNFLWRIEGGNVSVTGNSSTLEYTFADAGLYTVTLRVTSSWGDSVTSQTLSVAAPVGADLRFFDTVFAPADWTVSTARLGAGHEYGIERITVGNDPNDAYRRVTIEMGESLSGIGDALNTYHWKRSAIYDPAVSGAITSIDFALDTLVIEGLQPRTALVVLQGNRLYRAAYDTPWERGVWRTRSSAGLIARDFVEVGADVLQPLPDSHPDLSASGARLQFGFQDAAYRPVGGIGGERSVVGFDNWSVTIHR